MKEIRINSKEYEDLMLNYNRLVQRHDVSPRIMKIETLSSLKNISQENDRFVYSNSLKDINALAHISYYSAEKGLDPNNTYECLFDDLQKDNDKYIAINSIESFKKGRGKELIERIFEKDDIKGIFLVPKNPSVGDYYSRIGFNYINNESDVMYLGKN